MNLTAEQRFDVLLPEYAADPSKPVYLEMAEELTAAASACGWNEARRAQAVALRAAHMMSLALDPARAGGTGGPVTAKREGDLSVSFGGSSSASRAIGDLEQTTFGLQLLALIRGSFSFLSVTQPHTDACT